MEDNRKHLDPASFGPMGFLLRSAGQGLRGIAGLIKSPLVLLPMLMLVGAWLFLPFISRLVGNMGSGQLFPVFKAIRLLTFSEGGMYGGTLGAIGGVMGKAFMAWFVTMIFLPMTKKKERLKTIKMAIGPAFMIKGGIDFALILAGAGFALILYNFKTGNGSTINSAVAVASILAAFKSLKNPRGFTVAFIRSFSKGKMKRATAGHFVVGMIVGYILAIVIAVVTGITGRLWYILGGFLLVLAFLIGVIFKTRRRRVIATILLLLTSFTISPVLSMAEPNDNNQLRDPYEVYKVEQGDFEKLKAAIMAKPFQSAQITPTGVTLGGRYVTIPGAKSVVIGSEDETSLSIATKSTPVEELFAISPEAPWMFSSDFEGRLSFSYDQDSSFLDEDIPNRTPFMLESSGLYTVVEGFQIVGGGTGSEAYPNEATQETHPVVFESYGNLKSNYYYRDAEYNFNTGDSPGQLYLKAQLAKDNEKNYGWMSAMTETDAEVFFRVDGISLKSPKPQSQTTEKTSLVWVLDDIIFNAFLNEGSQSFNDEDLNVSVDSGRIYSEHDIEGDGSWAAKATYTWTVPPERIPFSQVISLPTRMEVYLDGGEHLEMAPGDSIGSFSGKAVIKAKLEPSTDYQIVYKAYFGTDDGSPMFKSATKSNNYGELLGGVFDLIPSQYEIFETPFGELTHDNSILELSFSSSGIGDVIYIYRLSSELAYETIPGGDKQDVEDEDLEEDDFDDDKYSTDQYKSDSLDWNEYADEDLQTAVNVASVVGAIIGAGAALAGLSGFGGGGPGGWNIPGGKYDPSDGTLVVDYPGGSQEIYRLNPQTGEFESSYGSTLNIDKIESSNQQIAIDKELAKRESERVSQRRDGDTGYWNQVKQIGKLKNKYEKQAAGGKDNISEHMARHLGQLERDINSGKGMDAKKVNNIRDAHGKYTRGEIAHSNQIPGDYTNWQHAKDTIALSTEEISRGDSGKAIALRIVTGILTGGQSEFGFEAAKSVYKAKDYVDKGGDSWTEFMQQAALQTIAEEGMGRVVGGTLKLAGKIGGAIGSKIGKMVSKTQIGSKVMGKLSNAVNVVSDFFGQDITKTVKSIAGIPPKASSQAGQALKAANSKAAANAIKSANQQLDDAVKAAGSQADDVAKAAQSSSKVPSGKIEGVEKQWSDAVKKGNQQAQEEILKFKQNPKMKSPEIAKRDQLYKQGQQVGDQKVANLKRIQDRVNANPGAADAKEAYDEALRAVQQDKFAMNSLKKYEGTGANELRSNFNIRNEQHTQAALQNSRERLAQEHGVNPEDIKFVEATNTGSSAPRTIDSSRTAGKVDSGMHTKANYHGSASADDMIPTSAQFKGAPMDKDVTARIYDKQSKQWIDLPKEDVGRIYNQELYKSHHNSQLPRTTINGKDVVDDKAIKNFAKKMDHTVTDRTGADAYGRGDRDLLTMMDKRDGVKQFEDISSVTKTMEYKSNEWFSLADDLRDEAAKLATGNGSKGAVNQLLREAEASQGEGIRQLVKQFDNQVSQQVKAVASTGKNIKVPDKMMKSIRILDEIGKEGGISVAEAEAILKGMNTTVNDVVQQVSSIMDVIAKFK